VKKVPGKKVKLTGIERRERIIQAAMEVFSRNGFRGTTLRQLARRAGISEAMIYHHFPSKEALYDAMLEKRIEESRHLFFPAHAAHAKEDRIMVETIVGNYLRQQFRDSSFMRMLLFSALEGHELAKKYVSQMMQEFFHFFGTYLEERSREGSLKPLNGPVTARLILGMAFYFVLLREIFRDPDIQGVGIDAVTKDMVELILHGIATQAS
jgi:AcrR family transcriptional regulator